MAAAHTAQKALADRAAVVRVGPGNGIAEVAVIRAQDHALACKAAPAGPVLPTPVAAGDTHVGRPCRTDAHCWPPAKPLSAVELLARHGAAPVGRITRP